MSNNNYDEYNEYDELEKVYKKRKVKLYVLYGAVLVVFLVIGYLILSNISNGNENKISKSSEKSSVSTKKIDLDSYDKKDNKLVLNPMIPEVNNITNDDDEEPVKKEIKKEIKKVEKKEENSKVLIKVKNGHSLKELKNNYESFPNYETAIKIADIYFNQRNYHKSIEWAKKANNIDSKKEDSWLIYAKSLVELGNKKTAKKLLNAYLNIYGKNERIEKYLGSFK